MYDYARIGIVYTEGQLCRQYAVIRLEIFGSALREDFNINTSDLDLVVEFDPNASGSSFRRYFNFKMDLEKLLKRRVDLVELHAMRNTRLKRIIEKTKVPLYVAGNTRRVSQQNIRVETPANSTNTA